MDCLQKQSAAIATVLHPVPGLDGRDIPSLGLKHPRRELHRLLVEGIPVPLPRSLFGEVPSLH